MIVSRPQNATLSPKITLLFIALFYILNRLAWSDPKRQKEKEGSLLAASRTRLRPLDRPGHSGFLPASGFMSSSCLCVQVLAISPRFPLVRPLPSATSASPRPAYRQLKDLCSVASQVIWTCPTARLRTCRTTASGLLPPDWRGTFRQSPPSSPGSRSWCIRTCHRSLTPES